ncbi:hypothetical protein [Streptomyces scopuliridis]|uniref:hypothetical protein n=1 Tax=Streptomyces scopuliridis TaxID=452529 RepID=UPI00343E1FE5
MYLLEGAAPLVGEQHSLKVGGIEATTVVVAAVTAPDGLSMELTLNTDVPAADKYRLEIRVDGE